MNDKFRSFITAQINQVDESEDGSAVRSRTVRMHPYHELTGRHLTAGTRPCGGGELVKNSAQLNGSISGKCAPRSLRQSVAAGTYW